MFKNLKPALEETCTALIYKNHEIIIAENPEAIRVTLPLRQKRVERVQEYLKSSVSNMYFSTNEGKLILPRAAYKLKHFYDKWKEVGPPGTVCKNTSRGSSDISIFEV